MCQSQVMRWAVPLVAAVLVAEAAVLLLRPREGVIPPVPVQATEYFSDSELARASDFRGPQRGLAVGILAVEAGVLALLVIRPPRRLRGPVRRPILVAAAAGAALSVAVDAAPLPLKAAARDRARDVGLITQGWPGWAGDLALGWGIGAVIGGVAGAAGVALVRRLPRGWWVPGSAVVVAFGALTLYATPVVLDPLFNRFEPLPPGETRDDVLELARRAGVDVGEVYRIDASRRTTAANAYVAGLGRTKRVVLYDNLVDDFTRDETRLVIAHELAHVHYRDVPRGLLFLALVAPAGMFAAARLTRRLAPAEFADGRPPGPGVLPALALSITIVATGVTMISNQLSREVEARADSYALRLTDAPEPFIGFKRRVAVRNVSEPDPPAWWHRPMSTHPRTIERIGTGVAYQRGER
jgi:STE24 endopeptidase